MTDPRPHVRPGGTFRNPWPDSEPPSWRDVLRMLREQSRKDRPPTPARNSFPTATPQIVHPRAPHDVFSATWIGHSTVLLQVAGLNILTDPVFSQRAFPVQWAGPRRVMDPGLRLEDLPPLDVIVISHIHYDHLDKPAVKSLARAHARATWIVPLGVGRYVRPWGAERVVEVDWWEDTRVRSEGEVRVTAVPARHFSARRIGDRNKSLWCGFAFATDRGRALYVGDTAYHPQFGDIGERCGPFDLIMNPIGAYDPRWFMKLVHVDPEESVRAYREIVAAHPDAELPVMLGIHWGTFRLTDEAMDEPPPRTLTAWREAGLPEDRLWVARFGETRVIAAGSGKKEG